MERRRESCKGTFFQSLQEITNSKNAQPQAHDERILNVFVFSLDGVGCRV